MKLWHKTLLEEYKEGRKQLRKQVNALDDEVLEDKEDIKVINSMIYDMDYVIKWLDTAIMPDPSRKRYRAYTYKDEFVYGVNGYWDDSIGGFVTKNNYDDPYQQVINKIDKEIEVYGHGVITTNRGSKQ